MADRHLDTLGDQMHSQAVPPEPVTINSSGSLSLACDTLGRVNFACAQNDVAIIRRLAVRNETDKPAVDVRVTLRAAPPIVRETSWILDRVAPGSEQEISSTVVDIDVGRLSGLNEAELGELEFRIETDGIGATVERRRIDLLPRDQWGGLTDMAQVLAAFVSPNEPAVASLLKNAARLLEASGHNGSLDGYQSGDPRRAYMIAAAIWSAATGIGLTYAEPPASFEAEGQKIRGPARIAKEGLATCLDLTLFLAAALEAAGLNPAVLFAQNHAWLGVWVQQRDFGHVTEPDVVAIRKAVQAHELIPIETTMLTKRPAVGFQQAEDEGRRRLAEHRDSEFVMAVDIARSRAARIRPLATHAAADAGNPHPGDQIVSAALPPAPDFGLLPDEVREDAPQTPKGRIERWQRKLLDLSLRNRLLNFRDSKQTVPFRCADVAALEDALAARKRFQGLSLDDEDPIGERSLSAEEVRRIEEQVAHDAFERRQLAVPLPGKEMNNRFLTLYRRANSDLQEGGTNTLFLAAGFLRWKKKEGDTRSYRAPILLIPVRLKRRSAQSPFWISHHEDDVCINFTLIEFLKRDFDILIPELEGDLKRDASGIDVPLILETVRRKVRDVAGFEVVEDLALSTFSFSKYLMWKDLVDRSDKLRESRLVRHLIDGPDEDSDSRPSGEPLARDEIDHRHAPRTLFTPLPADSSQLAAVITAAKGADFVLVGPPGTGKSQTIANMIAQCLADGKTVLFVAEKAAALDVVHRRLVATGLGDAVLELHSNKTDRKSVIAQLGRGWERAAQGDEDTWNSVTDELQLSRDQLNEYVDALHQPGSQGFSVFDALGRVAAAPPPFKLSFASKDAHDRTSYPALVKLAGEVARVHAIASAGPPLSLIAHEQWSFQWQADILQAVNGLRAALDDLRYAERTLADQLGLTADPSLPADRRQRLKALAPRLTSDALDLSEIPALPLPSLAAHTDALARDLSALEAAACEASASYAFKTVRRMPVDELDSDWRHAQAKFWPASFFARRKVRKLLQTYVHRGDANPDVDLGILREMQDRLAAIDANPLASTAVAGESRDTERATTAAGQAIALRTALDALQPDLEDTVRHASATEQLTLASGSAVRDALARYLATEETVEIRERTFVANGGRNAPEASVAEFDAALETVSEEQARLADWTRWTETSNRAIAAGLTPLIEALDEGSLPGSAEEAFKQAYAAWWLPPAMDAHPALRRFTHWDHENLIETFRTLDDKVASLAPLEIMRRIAHDLPPRDAVRRKSELGALRHQLGLKRPSMPVRRLLENLKDSFGKLAPCVLMSPLSIAQYLPAGRAAFDAVIFDEASQITTWDAIGAIARGRQTIVVGDPKQLPPTNFFGRTDDEDDELPEIERDMPSILDEVAASGVSERRLDWHYRSRDEALIAFSNRFYYGGRLVTFPAPTTGGEALQFHKVDGTYARGHGGRVNPAEAEAVAEMARRCLTNWLDLPEADRLTLGVITFNAEQQSLILDHMDALRRENAKLEWFFSDDREEPVIIKNLENIQGDERDVMLFSVTFGPDAAGKLTMNFGPLNNSGGERRLNVAVTRARRELHIFSSIRAEEIDLHRTRAEGVRDLKAFLDYAERGPIALPAREEGAFRPAGSPFEEAVAQALRAKGWDVRTQIGVSGFRIDLGIVHPNRAGNYLCGIECDGARYHSSATARDRDKVRQSVLEGLGWRIFRIWSTDWFKNHQAVIERIDRQLRQLFNEVRKTPDPPQPQAKTPTPPPPAHSLARTPVEQPAAEEANESKEPSSAAWQSAAYAGSSTAMRTPSPPRAALRFANADAGDRETPKPVSSSAAEDPPLDPERFFDPDYAQVLRDFIVRIVQAEGPITVRRLTRRVAQEHGWQRAGKRIQERVQRHLAAVECHAEFTTSFAWSPGTHAQRSPFRGLAGRSITHVSRTEIASVIDRHSLELAAADDPIRTLARRLGIGRLTERARSYLSECLDWHHQDGKEGSGADPC